VRAAGSISAAALAVGNPLPAPVLAAHCDETEFAEHVARQPICAEYKHAQLQVYRRFRRCWPDLHAWLARCRFAPKGEMRNSTKSMVVLCR
jgi:hypothetical protein